MYNPGRSFGIGTGAFTVEFSGLSGLTASGGVDVADSPDENRKWLLNPTIVSRADLVSKYSISGGLENRRVQFIKGSSKANRKKRIRIR